MANLRRSAGIAHIALALILLVVAVIGAAGYAVVVANQSNKASNTPTPAKAKPAPSTSKALTKQSGGDVATTEQDKVMAGLKVYCQTEYKKVWEGSYNITIDPTKVTASYDDTVEDPGRISGNFAVITVAKCDTPQLTEFQKFAPFKLYLQKTDNTWKGYVRTQSTPQCSKFDNKGWPSEILPQCLDNGTVRAPKS